MPVAVVHIYLVYDIRIAGKYPLIMTTDRGHYAALNFCMLPCVGQEL